MFKLVTRVEVGSSSKTTDNSESVNWTIKKQLLVWYNIFYYIQIKMAMFDLEVYIMIDLFDELEKVANIQIGGCLGIATQHVVYSEGKCN